MRAIALAIAIFASSLAAQQPEMAFAQNNDPTPDLDLAYVLAAASYCSCAVGEADKDHGQERAQQCLRAAADRDPELLAVLGMSRPMLK
jgi:hypothetical protein